MTKFIRSLPTKVAEARKFLIVAVPAVGLVVGTSNPWYVKAIAVLTAAGVYGVKNRPKS